MIQKYIDQIEFDEQHYNTEMGTVVFYFTAPVEMLNGRYPDAVSAEISVEFLMDGNNVFLPYTGYCEISPTKEELDGSFSDYDWAEMVLSKPEIDLLLKVYDEFNQARRRDV